MLETPPAHWADTANWPDSVDPGDVIPDIAHTIASEVATEWGLDLADTGSRIMVWAHIEHHAQGVVRRALGKLADGIEDPDTINCDRVAELTSQPDADTARTHYPPDPEWH